MKTALPSFVLLCALFVAAWPVRGAEPAQVTPEAEQQKILVDGNNSFALDLYAKLKSQDGNLFFSPYSISTALAMTYAGARGETEKQMAQTLHFDLTQAELHSAYAQLAKNLSPADEKAAGYQLAIANALWGQQGYNFLPDFIALIDKAYGGGVRRVNFARNVEAAGIINDWVEEETRKKIQKLVPPGMLNALTVLVLTNAIYFKGTWEVQFDPRKTSDQPFILADGQKARAPMMTRSDNSLLYANVGDVQLLQLPYSGKRLSMLILLPRQAAGIGELEAQLSPAKLAEWLGTLKSTKVGVLLPKFRMNWEDLKLEETLKTMGMTDAFSAPPADFSGIGGTTDLFISHILHKAFVDVNEEGTEAAAATAVIISRGSGTPIFYANHPFIFLIRDDTTGAILFIGRVMNPNDTGDK